MTRPHILVASLLPEQGYCGVQTHARAVIGFARKQGYEARLVEPHQTSRWVRLPSSLVTRALRRTDPERAVIWHREWAERFLRARLRSKLDALRDQPVVIYAQDPLSARAALALRDAGYRFRLVAVLHFNISEAYEHQLNGFTREEGALWRALMRVEREVLPRIDKVIFVSDYMRRIVQSRNPALSVVWQTVIPNFPEHEIETVADAAPRADLITIGTLEPRKNQGYLLYVLAAAKQQGFRYRMTIAGDGPSRTEWEVLAATLGVADQVDFLGYVSGASRLLQGHRAYVHAAHMESFGIVLVEALAHGMPVFASPVGGIPEVFDDGVEGVAWPLDKPAECAQKLIAVLESPAACRAMSSAARLRYRTRFAPGVLGPRWLEAITADAPEAVCSGAAPELELSTT